MKQLIRVFFIACLFLPFSVKAQFETFKDSVVQLYGVVMTADSLKAIPGASIMVKGQNRGTLTNNDGIFSIVVMKGDVVNITHVSYKTRAVKVPSNIEGNQYSLIQLMVADTVYMPATIIKRKPTREEFERDFVNTAVPDDDIEIARQNTEESKRRVLAATLPADGREATSMAMSSNAAKYYYKGQMPPMQIFNPMAWNEFIKAWKRGDYKKKN
jgi:CarboxypepD_reg-like domain